VWPLVVAISASSEKRFISSGVMPWMVVVIFTVVSSAFRAPAA
jgi:hypothetical protein